MKIEEWVGGSGIYKVSKDTIGEYTEFLRKNDRDGEVQPLLHICEKDIDPQGEKYLCLTGVVRWDFQGWYKCIECKKTFLTQDELEAVWSDGKGTGDETEV